MTMSRIKVRSAKSFEVNQEKPNWASSLVGGRGFKTTAAPLQARSSASRDRKDRSASLDRRAEGANSSAAAPAAARRLPSSPIAVLVVRDRGVGWLDRRGR